MEEEEHDRGWGRRSGGCSACHQHHTKKVFATAHPHQTPQTIGARRRRARVQSLATKDSTQTLRAGESDESLCN